MNSRLKDFENLITRPDGSVDDIFSENQRETNELEQLITMNPQQAYQLSTSIQAQHDSLDVGIKAMRNSFGKGVSEVLKEKPVAANLTKYQNVLPYGVEEIPAGTNPNRPTLKQDVNAGLENLDPSLTKNIHSTYTRIFHIMFKDTYKQLKTDIFEDYGNSSVSESDIDGLCLNHIFSSAIGSMFDWTSIDPKSVGLGSIEHITDLFQKYYFGEIDEKKPATPWEEKQSDYRKYTSGGGNILEIQGDKFYDDFINGSFFRHCLQGYVSKTKTAPTTFEKRIEGFYDFNPELWFDNEDATGKVFKHCDPAKHCDSYGNFFKVKQPVRIDDAITVGLADPRVKGIYTGAGGIVSWETALGHAAAKKNLFTGMYDTYNVNASQTFILTNEPKPLCCLFHKGAIRDREFVKADGVIANRIFTVPTLTDFDFRTTELASYGSGTDNGPDAHSILAGANASINQVAQLLYNSKSIGFHLTPGSANASTSLVAGTTHTGIQMITGYSCGKLTGAANTYINDNANIAAADIQRVTAVGLVLTLSQIPGVGYVNGGGAIQTVGAAANSLVANAPADLNAAGAVATALAHPAVITAIQTVGAAAETARVNALASVNAYIAVAGAGAANSFLISNGARAPTAGAVYTNLIGAAAAAAPDAAAITSVLSKESYQFIPLTTLMKGGNHIKSHSGSGKHKTDKVKSPPIKRVSKAKLPSSKKDRKDRKDKKQNPVKKVKKRITKQKGGAHDNFFDIRNAGPYATPPSLDASRRSVIISKSIFENYRKALTEYIKRFGSGMNPTKIQDDILTKITNITHLGIFYHGPDDTLNFGDGGAHANSIKFEDLGEMFLFCSVITNTIKLMIHFFSNIKACVLHFIKTELETIVSHINKKLKVVNTTNISSANVSYFEKYIAGCEELNKNIDNLIKFLKNNTMCLGEPKSNGDPAGADALAKNEQQVINLFFGANIHHQNSTKNVGPPMGANFAVTYPIEFYTFHHDLINFFSSSERTFKRLNTMKFQRSLRILTSNDVVLNNGYPVKNPTAHAYPKEDYSITNASLGGIPMTFGNSKPTHYSWMTFMFLLTHREKSNELLLKENSLEINRSLSQVSSQEKSDIRKNVIDTYKSIRPVIADPKVDLGSKNKILQKVFFSFFEESNRIAKKIIDDHLIIEKKSKRTNIRSKTTITNIIQRRTDSDRILIPDEIKIQKEMHKFSYKADCLVNLLHSMLISGPHGSMKNYIIFMYTISRLRNFVNRLYYLNKTYYIENETMKKKLLADSGFDLSKNSKTSNTKKTFELFNKLTHTQLIDQNSDTENWWNSMERAFRDRTTEVHGKYYRLFTYVLIDGEVFLIDIFSMAKSTHSIKSYSEILKKDVEVYGDNIYSPDNMFIKLQTDFTKDTKYKKLLMGELHYEYTKQGSGKKKKKILEPLFIQGSTIEQLKSIIRDNHYIPAIGRRPEQFISSTRQDTSFQIYKIHKHFVLHASAFRSWAYNLLFSMPTRIDVDDSYFKLHLQTSVSTIPSLAKSQVLPSLKEISKLNQNQPIVEFKSKVRVNNNSKLLMNNNINNKRISSSTKYISREQLIMLGLVFGDSLH